VTAQRIKLVTWSHYGLVRCAVGIWPSQQKDDTVTAGAGVEVQRDVTTVRSSALLFTPDASVLNSGVNL